MGPGGQAGRRPRGGTVVATSQVVTVESLAAGGAGLAHLGDGMAVFVPRTAPGDRVRLGGLRHRRRYATARLAELLEPGPGRVEPRCAHFVRDRCGGCQWQHLALGAQQEAKRRIVGDALRRIGGLDLSDPELVASPRALGYRTTVTLTVRRAASHLTAGFHDDEDADRIFQLERCWIARPELADLWDAVRGALSCLPAGDDVRLKLRLATDGSLHALVSGGERAWTRGGPIVEAARKAGVTVTVWWQPGGGAVRRVAGPAADPALVAFEQVNAEVAGMLREAVVGEADRQAVRRSGAKAVSGSGSRLKMLDLYAGTGEIAMQLAELGHEVVMVEVDARSVRYAEQRARSAGLSLQCIVGRVEEQIGRLVPADLIIVNPPRAGLSHVVTDRLYAFPPDRLIYVSCDPATLARDLRRLAVTASQVSAVRAYDMFPQTSHVETLVVLDWPSDRLTA